MFMIAAALLAVAQGESRPAPLPADAPDLAEKLMIAERYEEAAALLERGAGNARALRLRGLALLELHRFADAKVSFAEAVRLAPDDAGAWIGSARAAEMLGERDAAERATAEALRLAPENADVLFAAGQSAARRRDDAQASKYLQHALRLAPWSGAASAAHYALAGIARRAGDAAEAALQKQQYDETFEFTSRRTALTRRMLDAPNDAATARALGELYLRAGVAREALSMFDSLVRSFPADAGLRTHLAEAAVLAGDAARARKEASEALRLDARVPGARRVLGEIDAASGALAAAVGHFEAAADSDPTGSRDPKLKPAVESLLKKARDARNEDVARRADSILKRLLR